MDTYMNLLNRQYRKSMERKLLDINTKSYKSDFLVWLSERNKLSITYLTILDKLGFIYDDKKCIEIGKGAFDSVVLDKKTTMLTPFIDGLKEKNNPILEGKLRIFKESFVVVNSIENLTNINYINSNYYNTLMTHNPLVIDDITNWEDIHNSNELDIIVGMFGLTIDKDRKDKIIKLKDLRDKLSYNSYKFECTTIRDAYYAVIGSKKLVKRIIE